MAPGYRFVQQVSDLKQKKIPKTFQTLKFSILARLHVKCMRNVH